jgi:hypothetical protein
MEVEGVESSTDGASESYSSVISEDETADFVLIIQQVSVSFSRHSSTNNHAYGAM